MTDPRRAAAPGLTEGGAETLSLDGDNHNDTTVIANATTDLTADGAKSVTNAIRQRYDITATYYKKAWEGRAWIALGYDSWDCYCDTEFEHRYRLGREDRRGVVLELRDVGMSTRAIASATGASRTTVISDIRSAEVVQSVPRVDDDVIDAELVTPTTPVVGLDGKRYEPKAHPPVKPRRRPPINCDLFMVANALRKATNRSEELAEDDRFDLDRDWQLAREVRRIHELTSKLLGDS